MLEEAFGLALTLEAIRGLVLIFGSGLGPDLIF
jgi:hypothetical protein